jgi:5-methylcytosine-specific restriction protein A
MPSAPPRVCNRCKKPAPKGQPCTCRPAFEGSTHPSSNDRHWQRVRDQQLRDHPHCQWPGCHRLADDEVDHITPLAEGGERYDPHNLQSLCKPHHDQKTSADALRGKTRAR